MNKNKSQEKTVFPMRSIRDELGLTQRELAIALGVDAMTILEQSVVYMNQSSRLSKPKYFASFWENKLKIYQII